MAVASPLLPISASNFPEIVVSARALVCLSTFDAHVPMSVGAGLQPSPVTGACSSQQQSYAWEQVAAQPPSPPLSAC